ncbi:hypothetical protein ANN_10243 [Periplaneta americana]|uniref:Endonuclease-reverse transcriptase n=1 Tax=Periplaneta americana TaxID=6978 RepID=A0ABQ8TNW0_PERAM|nr:hypothetical protein ANN_10243 [Periplaneta americana]
MSKRDNTLEMKQHEMSRQLVNWRVSCPRKWCDVRKQNMKAVLKVLRRLPNIQADRLQFGIAKCRNYYKSENLCPLNLLSKNLKVRIYKTVILCLSIVLYGCETWTLTLREEQRLRRCENKVLRKIFEAKRDEVTGEWRKLHNAELHALFSSPDIIRNIKSRRLRWAEHVARMGESRNAYRVLVGRPEGKRPLGKPRRRREDNIKMDLREVGYDDRDWINLQGEYKINTRRKGVDKDKRKNMRTRRKQGEERERNKRRENKRNTRGTRRQGEQGEDKENKRNKENKGKEKTRKQ